MSISVSASVKFNSLRVEYYTTHILYTAHFVTDFNFDSFITAPMEGQVGFTMHCGIHY